MRFHDAYLRRTPFEIAFAAVPGAERLPAAVREEAEARGMDSRDPQAFLMLECVTRFLREVRGPEGAGLIEHGALAYHAVHFAGEGRSVLLVPTSSARALTDRDWSGPEPRLPAGAGYVQLPRHLFWVRTGAGGTAEPVDGWFWTLSGSGHLTALLIAGLREDRPGFSAVPLPEAPWSDAPEWTGADARAEGGDFEPTLPGGELDGLHSFETAGEVLKLTARLFARVAEGGLRPAGAPSDVEPRGEAPARSSLSYSRVEP